MSRESLRFDLRWVGRHPLAWLRICWWHWAIAFTLWAKALVTMHEVYDVTKGFQHWPIALGALGGMIALSSITPTDRRVQIVTGSALFGVAVARILDLWVVSLDVSLGSAGTALARTMALHWVFVAVVAFHWPSISAVTGGDMVTQGGKDDRAG